MRVGRGRDGGDGWWRVEGGVMHVVMAWVAVGVFGLLVGTASVLIFGWEVLLGFGLWRISSCIETPRNPSR